MADVGHELAAIRFVVVSLVSRRNYFINHQSTRDQKNVFHYKYL